MLKKSQINEYSDLIISAWEFELFTQGDNGFLCDNTIHEGVKFEQLPKGPHYWAYIPHLVL